MCQNIVNKFIKFPRENKKKKHEKQLTVRSIGILKYEKKEKKFHLQGIYFIYGKNVWCVVYKYGNLDLFQEDGPLKTFVQVVFDFIRCSHLSHLCWCYWMHAIKRWSAMVKKKQTHLNNERNSLYFKVVWVYASKTLNCVDHSRPFLSFHKNKDNLTFQCPKLLMLLVWSDLKSASMFLCSVDCLNGTIWTHREQNCLKQRLKENKSSAVCSLLQRQSFSSFSSPLCQSSSLRRLIFLFNIKLH